MSSRHVVIIGAGQAGRRTAETLRELGADLAITLVGAEPHLPYDRPPLSKSVLHGEPAGATVFIRDEAFYARSGIALRLGAAAIELDRDRRVVTLADGVRLDYDSVVLATGSRPRTLSIDGFAAADIHHLRTIDDALALGTVLRRSASLAIVGGGLIGLEVAAAARAHGCRVVVIEAASRLLSRAMPASVSHFVAELHRRNGVELLLPATPDEVLRAIAPGRYLVRTGEGEHPVDAIVAGIGAVPNTELLAASGLATPDGVPVGIGGRTADPAVFAAGEVASILDAFSGRRLRVESWQWAQLHAAEVARAVLGLPPADQPPPWFWSDQYDCNIQVLGVPDWAPAFLTERRAGPQRLSCLQTDATGRVLGGVFINAPKDAAVARRAMIRGRPVDRAAFADPAVVAW